MSSSSLTAAFDSASIEQLLDPNWLEHEGLLALGLNNEEPQEFPAHLRPHMGKGLQIWQYPNQFAPFLVWLQQNFQPKSLLEIGTRHGGTAIAMTAYFRRFQPEFHAVAMDLNLNSETALRLSSYGITGISGDSRAPHAIQLARANGPYDVVFIDGDHSYHGVSTDAQNYAHLGKVVVFHDIVNSVCPGVVRYWKEWSAAAGDRAKTFTAQYPSVPASFLGIGVTYGT